MADKCCLFRPCACGLQSRQIDFRVWLRDSQFAGIGNAVPEILDADTGKPVEFIGRRIEGVGDDRKTESRSLEPRQGFRNAVKKNDLSLRLINRFYSFANCFGIGDP